VARAGLEIRGPASAPLDEPLALSARGAGEAAGALVWRARLHDDDGRVWRASADRSEALDERWSPAKASTGAVAALGSLRPVAVDARVEAGDGRAAARSLTRRIVDEGVRMRRWRAPVAATLCLPRAGEEPCATVLLDATAGGDEAGAAAVAGALLAGRGALVLVVPAARGDGAGLLAAAREAIGAVPGAGDPVVIAALVPPGVPAAGDAAARAAAWDALLARLGARARGT
jgi:hypothetical protein